MSCIDLITPDTFATLSPLIYFVGQLADRGLIAISSAEDTPQYFNGRADAVEGLELEHLGIL